MISLPDGYSQDIDNEESGTLALVIHSNTTSAAAATKVDSGKMLTLTTVKINHTHCFEYQEDLLPTFKGD